VRGRERAVHGVTYWSGALGPYIWHEFDPTAVAADLHRIAALGHQRMHTWLAWDAFMPEPDRVDVTRLRDFERLLELAGSQSLQVVPVLFVQSAGGCLMLPPFAIDVSRPRPGVRPLTGGVTQPGGPRDLYTEPLMLEAALRWAETMVGAFANHESVAAWGLGHDPAGTVRPRRIEHLQQWMRAIAQPFRDAGQRCGIILGTDDFVTARGVRPALVAAECDELGVELDLSRLPESGGDAAARSHFFVQLAQRLSGVSALHVHLSACEMDDTDPDSTCMSAADIARYAGVAVSMLAEAGCAGVHAAQWSRPGERVHGAAPFDRAPALRHRGVVDAHAKPTSFGERWAHAIRAEREVGVAEPWPAQLDVNAYYANLSTSFRDLHAAWSRGRTDDPAMLD
jgi:hypothetical protein